MSTLTKIQNGSYPKSCFIFNRLNEDDLSVELVNKFVGNFNDNNEKYAVSFVIHPAAVKVNDNNSIDIDFNLYAVKEIYNDNFKCDIMNDTMVDEMNFIVNEASSELDIQFKVNKMNVKTYAFNYKNK